MDSKVTACVRCLAADVVQKADSGHPGAPMGMAPVANVLFSEFLKFNPADPHWHDRDRFVLSNGHASALIYTMLHLAGYNLPMDQLKQFRQLHSITPGHPERHITPGIEVTTGPLGQGISNAVGLAMAEAHLAAVFNKPDATLVDHKTWVFCGDGCLMEGVAQEALSLAGHLALEKLIVVYDDNHISIDGNTDIAYTEDKERKYQALGFHTIVVKDGDKDYSAIRAALTKAQSNKGKPTMILLHTTIGFGSKLQGTAKVHGSPLGDKDIANVKKMFGRDPEKKFFVEAEVYDHFKKAAGRGASAQGKWNATFKAYKEKYPADAAKYEAFFSNALPEGWKDKLPRNDKKAVATRKASENSLAALLPLIPNVVGGSADLTGSNLTRPGEAKLVDFQKETPQGRYIRFGVREHGMCAVLNGIDAHGGLIGFGGTFLNFIGYAMGAVRLSALSEHGVIFVATHDSIGLGEDGPTHQPIEIVAGLRATPNLLVIRPADQTETSAAWATAIERRNTPTCLCLSRQAAAPLQNSSFEGAQCGGYVVVPCAKPKVVIVASGTEVATAVKAAQLLPDLAVRVVSMPCIELFEQQSVAYQQSIIPDGVPVLSVEPYCSFGWDRYSHFHVGIDKWGLSAPAEKIYEHYGITPKGVAGKAAALAAYYGGRAPSKIRPKL